MNDHDLERGGYHDVASHIAPLALALEDSYTILEIGCGWYSTPLIHAVRPGHALTIDTDAAWVAKFKPLNPDRIVCVNHLALEATALRDRGGVLWQCVFIDSAKGEDRVECAKIFLDTDCRIVIHDSQEPYWQDLLKTVKFQRHFDFMSPRTSFISNVLDVTKE